MKPLVLIAGVNTRIMVDVVKSGYMLSIIMIYFLHPVPGGTGAGCACTPLLPGFGWGPACHPAEMHLSAQVFLLAFLQDFVQLLKEPQFLAGAT